MREMSSFNPQEESVPSETIDLIFGKIEELLNERSDKLPEAIKHSTDPDSKIKARKGVIAALLGYFQILNQKGIVKDPELSEEINQAALYFTSDEFKSKRRTERGDIERLNSLGRKILLTRERN